METAGPRVGSPHRVDARSKLAEFHSKQLRRRKADDAEKRKQLHDYVAWVNTYLKRRPGVKLICDLRSFSDGVTLVQLAEIVTKDSIPGVVALPSSAADRSMNIEKVCAFLKEKGVILPPDIVKDIIDSSLKAAMRMVLAIANHFFPTTVKRGHTLPQQNRTIQLPSHHYQNGRTTPPRDQITHTRSLPLGKSPPYFRDDYRESSHHRSLTPERPESPIYSTPIDAIEGEVAESARRASFGRSMRRRENGGLSESKHVLILEELAQSQTEVMDLKNQMLQLFALLQRNPNCSPATVMTPELPRSDSQQSDSETSDGLTTNIAAAAAANGSQDNGKITSRSIDQLREQLEQCRGEVEEEERDTGQFKKELDKSKEQLKKLKSELLRKDYKHDTEMVDIQNVLSEKEILILSLRQELSQHREGISKEMEQLSQQLEHSQSSFLAQLREKDAELATLRDQVRGGSSQMTNGTSEKHKKTLPEEMDAVRTCLGALRTSLSPQDPQQQTIDQLEQAMASLADQRLMSSPTNTTSPTPSKRHSSRSGRHRTTHDDSGDNRHSRKKHMTTGSGEVSPGMASYPSPMSPDEVTKVMYYLDKDDTPYRTSIPKRCFEVTLKDFRSAIYKSSAHKFFFKSLDPDIGAVKEEVSDSSAIVPNYEGKIVGWVSERTK